MKPALFLPCSYLHDKQFYPVYDSNKRSRNRKWGMHVEMEDGKVIIKKRIIKEDNAPENVKDDSSLQSQIPEDINMLVTGMLHKDGKSFVRVSFLRGKDWAEGIVPDAKIEKSEGFTREEIGRLEAYLLGEKAMILEQAKGVNPLRNMFGM